MPLLYGPPTITRTPRSLAQRQQPVGGAPVEQGVAAGEEDDVELDPLEQEEADLDLVDPDPDRIDRALILQLAHRAVAGVEEGAHVAFAGARRE